MLHPLSERSIDYLTKKTESIEYRKGKTCVKGKDLELLTSFYTILGFGQGQWFFMNGTWRDRNPASVN